MGSRLSVDGAGGKKRNSKSVWPLGTKKAQPSVWARRAKRRRLSAYCRQGAAKQCRKNAGIRLIPCQPTPANRRSPVLPENFFTIFLHLLCPESKFQGAVFLFVTDELFQKDRIRQTGPVSTRQNSRLSLIDSLAQIKASISPSKRSSCIARQPAISWFSLAGTDPQRDPAKVRTTG